MIINGNRIYRILTMSNEQSRRRIDRIQGHKWYGPITAYILGVFCVIFLALFGGAIEQSTNLITFTGEIITSVRMASIGLGTGFYFGSSLKSRSRERSWFLFGIFSVLTIGAITSVDEVIFGQYPVYILLVTGGVLSTLAHLTPLVAENEDYMKFLKYVTGYITTGIVVVLATGRYILTIIGSIWEWFSALGTWAKFTILLLLFFSITFMYVIVYFDQQAKKDSGE
mgnify:CR=1 FL=1